MYYTPLMHHDREIRVGIHESIFEMFDRPEIATDVIAPLLTFCDRLAASSWLNSATKVTYLKVQPFEYYPIIVIDLVVAGKEERRYFGHGSYDGWYQIGPIDLIFAGTRPAEEGEIGTVSTSSGMEVATHRNAIELINEVLDAS